MEPIKKAESNSNIEVLFSQLKFQTGFKDYYGQFKTEHPDHIPYIGEIEYLPLFKYIIENKIKFTKSNVEFAHVQLIERYCQYLEEKRSYNCWESKKVFKKYIETNTKKRE